MSTKARQIPPPAALVAGALLLAAFVAVFLAAFKSPAPNRLDVAVVAAPAAVEALQAQLDRARPGALELHAHRSSAAAREALLDRRVEGIVVAEGGTPRRLIVASAAGLPVAEALEEALSQLVATSGGALRVEDAKPLPERDSRGLAAFFLILGTTIASVLVGGMLHVLGREAPPLRLALLLCAWAALGGGTAIAAADWVAGAVGGSAATFGLLSLLALAVAGTAVGAARWLGAGGLALVALTMIVLGVSASGGPVGSPLQPGFFQALSGALPPGAGLEAVRGALYFDRAGTLGPTVVLAIWSLGGLTLVAASGLRGRRMGSGHGTPRTASVSA